ncbi:response regulator [Membranihabitans maritimus]|uniref:response regulator n=1 Tax=Membranihabitans maritimus TaxID=2904244 RepID=UPI001F2E29D8|nr:response regulator transcription factor [Membranihabitans maritimus]
MSNQFKFTAFTLTNILVVEDHRVVQVGIRMLLEDSGIKYTIKYASNFPKAIEILSNHTIDLVILDLNVPGGNNTKMIELLKIKNPSIKVLVFSSFDEKIYARQCLRSGAEGFISKTAPDHEFKKALYTVLSNQIYASEHIQQELLTQFNDSNNNSRLNPLKTLSTRETDVMKLLVKGFSTNEISNQLNLQPSTISTYKNRIFKKMTVNNVVELIEQIKFLEGK